MSRHKFDPVEANKIVQFCCMMIIVALVLIVLTDINSAETLEDTNVWQVAVWSCWMVLVFMGIYGAGYVRNLVKHRRRGRSK